MCPRCQWHCWDFCTSDYSAKFKPYLKKTPQYESWKNRDTKSCDTVPLSYIIFSIHLQLKKIFSNILLNICSPFPKCSWHHFSHPFSHYKSLINMHIAQCIVYEYKHIITMNWGHCHIAYGYLSFPLELLKLLTLHSPGNQIHSYSISKVLGFIKISTLVIIYLITAPRQGF